MERCATPGHRAMTAAGGLLALPRDPLSQGAIEALVSGRHGDPFAVLGRPHRDALRGQVVRPGVARALLIDPGSGEPLAEFARIHQEGLFSATLGDAAERPRYRLRFTEGDHAFDEEDPYRFRRCLAMSTTTFAEVGICASMRSSAPTRR